MPGQLGRFPWQTRRPTSARTIDRVREYREIDGGQVNTQLMSAPCLGLQPHMCEPVKALDDLPVGERLSPLTSGEDALAIRVFGVSPIINTY